MSPHKDLCLSISFDLLGEEGRHLSKLCVHQATAELSQAWHVSWCSTNAEWTNQNPVAISSTASSLINSLVHSFIHSPNHWSTHPSPTYICLFIHSPTNLCCPSIHIFPALSIHPSIIHLSSIHLCIHPLPTHPPISVVHPFIPFYHIYPSFLIYHSFILPPMYAPVLLPTSYITCPFAYQTQQI